MTLEQERIKSPLMEYYRHVYAFSKRWNGKDDLTDKTVILYMEQGYGDCIQFLRFVEPLKERCKEVILHAPKALHPLLNNFKYFDKHIPDLPDHDYHILSLSLPFLLDTEISPKSYIEYDKITEVEKGLNVGIAWEGSPEHPKNLDRCCPLKHFKVLDNVNLFMLQDKIYLPELLDEAEDLTLYGTEINDFGDTAALINAMDFVISVDTSILHLAGAMGKKTYGLLSSDPDPRWEIANWYDSVTLLKGTWEDQIKESFKLWDS